MKHFLMIDSDTRLEFSSRSKAFSYSDKHCIPSMVLTVYEGGKASVFNPYIAEGSTKCVEYFENENDALKYIGSFN